MGLAEDIVTVGTFIARSTPTLPLFGTVMDLETPPAITDANSPEPYRAIARTRYSEPAGTVIGSTKDDAPLVSLLSVKVRSLPSTTAMTFTALEGMFVIFS